MWNKLYILLKPQQPFDAIPCALEPAVVSGGEEFSVFTRLEDFSFENGTDLVNNGYCSGMSVLGFPSRDCSKFKVDISAFDAPAFSKAEPRIEKDEKDFRMGVLSVLDECFDKGIFFFLRQEAYPMVSLFSEGDFRHHF